ncbi:MAG TPA: hypothetical protein VMO47_10825 [Rhodothermales bacterium]|nr:hypothetical protein [Rhodothermales bacterium]
MVRTFRIFGRLRNIARCHDHVTDRRYNEEEIATIFEHAASAQRAEA